MGADNIFELRQYLSFKLKIMAKNPSVKSEGESKLSPSDFMRARRPELFSDTRFLNEPRLNKDVFELKLETLTARKEEIQFEHFCRRLAEKELCPNLLLQTGPTGGGDSKVDTETYPVADEISLRWYEGLGREAAAERWAFAFSAKKDWRTKVKSDISGIAKTKRGYPLAFFITNQNVRDKARSQVEDELSKKWKIQVRILDRRWIIDRIFKGRYFDLAIETLGMDDVSTDKREIKGPHDTERLTELQELDALIADPNRYKGAEYQLAEDCLQTALLARGLSHPRTEIEGRFQRAERIANKVGARQQQFRFAYQKAWTSYWWFDDFDEFNNLYDRAEELVRGTDYSWNLELLVNLWILTNATVMHHGYDAQAMKLEKRTEYLRSELIRLSNNDKRPTNTLWAQTQLTIMDLILAARDQKRLPEIFVRIEDILRKAENLPEFPMESLIKFVREIGLVMGEAESYDRLIEVVLRLVGDRTSRSEQGRLLTDRGYQKLRAGGIYDAIRLFGRAQMLLAMKEHRGTFVRALTGTALGYEAAGLLWAARANLIIGLNQLLNKFLENGELDPILFPILKKLVWVELQIGRIPSVFGWIELMWAVAHGLKLDQKAQKLFDDEYRLMDAVLGILLLKTEYRDLRQLDAVPALLDHFDLILSRTAVLYALGHEKVVCDEAQFQNEDLLKFYSKWIEQPASEDLPAVPQWMLSDEVELKSYVLGCEVVLRVRNQSPSILIAESILAILEAFLATSLDRRLMPYRSTLLCELIPSEYIVGPLEFRVDEDDCGEPVFKILHSSGNVSSVVKHDAFREKIVDLIVMIISHIAIPNDEGVLDELAARERVFDRAFSLTELAIPITNIFGDIPKYHLIDWSDRAIGETFTLLRSLPWQAALNESNTKQKIKSKPPKLGKGPPPQELFGVDGLKHRDQRVFSIVNKSLWDKANWKGVLYAVPPPPSPPVFALLFEKREDAEKIFRGWQKRVGDSDANEVIRVTIITGIDHLHPTHYRVVIMQNPDLIGENKDDQRIVVILLRKNTMMPTDSRNLDLFLEAWNQSKEYLLAPAVLTESNEPDIGLGMVIRKKELKLIPAWEIDVNSPEIMALNKDDKPIIPDNISDPPIHRAMDWLAQTID